MRRQSKKLSGPALARYLRRYYGGAPGLSTQTAEQLARRSTAAFSSVRVRASALEQSLAAPRAAAAATVAADPGQMPTPAAATPPDAASAFDPYAIGLVPTCQREGRDGLVARLGAITSADQLRQMARAQQIGLPEALRQGDVAADVLRAAIADAVAKRIADRRAAAG